MTAAGVHTGGKVVQAPVCVWIVNIIDDDDDDDDDGRITIVS